MKYVDPDGRRVKGVSSEDAQLFKEDTNHVLSDEKFTKVKDLIKVEGKTFLNIDQQSLANALEGFKLTDDEQAFIEMLTNTINSEDIHKIEYAKQGDNISYSGEKVFAPEFAKAKLPINLIIEKNGGIPVSLIESFCGGGITTKTHNGTHSIVINNSELHGNGRAVTTCHEIFGHGRSLALGRTGSQHEDAIQTENMILRIMKINQTNNGMNHGPRTFLPNATLIPSFR